MLVALSVIIFMSLRAARIGRPQNLRDDEVGVTAVDRHLVRFVASAASRSDGSFSIEVLHTGVRDGVWMCATIDSAFERGTGPFN